MMFRKYRYGDRSQVIKKSIQTLVLVLVIFTMSLGYAALSQYMEIEGMAVIDNRWNVTITSVTASVTNSGANLGSTIAGNTATLHANLPNSNSTVIYSITVKNNGNVAGVLFGIEVLEDTNSNITYAVTQGARTLAAGATTVIQVTVKYVNNNVSNPLKDLMVNINYIQDTTKTTTNATTTPVTGGTG